MVYDAEKNQRVLEGMLSITEKYAKGFPEMWDLYGMPGTRSGLPIIHHMKNPDASGSTTFVEIRREENGSLKFYDCFDGEAQPSSPERIAEKLGEEGATGRMNPETFTPEYLIERFSSRITKGINSFIRIRLSRTTSLTDLVDKEAYQQFFPGD